MSHRVGVCTSCRSRFQIPATFTPNRARCRTCGGVVEVGPALPATQEPVPAASEPPPPPPAPIITAAPPVTAPLPPEPTRYAPPPPAPKRRSILPALLAVGVLLALAFGIWQLFGS